MFKTHTKAQTDAINKIIETANVKKYHHRRQCAEDDDFTQYFISYKKIELFVVAENWNYGKHYCNGLDKKRYIELDDCINSGITAYVNKLTGEISENIKMYDFLGLDSNMIGDL